MSWQSGPVTERSLEPSLGSIPISKMLTRSTSASGDDPGPVGVAGLPGQVRISDALHFALIVDQRIQKG